MTASGQSPCILEWIRSLEGYKTYKYELNRLAQITFSRRLGRDSTFEMAYKLCINQLATLQTRRHPLVAVIGAPGCGKTFLLDEICSLRESDINQFCESRYRPLFSAALAITVTYNGETDTNLSGAQDTGTMGLVARILYMYYKRLLRMNFYQFFVKLQKHTRLTIPCCLEFVAEHFFSISDTDSVPCNSHLIILGVDEISKSGCETEILPAVGALCEMKISLRNQHFANVFPIITNLSKTFIYPFETGSQRPIALVPLQSQLQDADNQMIFDLEIEESISPIVSLLCRDFGYHGRMLEQLYMQLRNSTVLTRLKTVKAAAIPSLVSVVTQSCSTHFSLLIHDPLKLLEAVYCAISGKAVAGDSLPGGCSMTYNQLQESGIFLGDDSLEKEFITPVMSPLQITCWAEMILADTAISNETKHVARCLLRIFFARSQHTWEDFEIFHRDVEFVRRNILHRVSVRTFYCLDQSSSARALSQLPCALLDYVMDNSNLLLAERALTSTKLADEVLDIPAKLTNGLCTVVQLAAPNQAGYDVIISQRLVNESSPLIISSQCKWSRRGEQVDLERGQGLEKIKGFTADGNELKCLYVYAAARREPVLKDASEHAENVIILDIDDLKRFYGPTVAGAHCFQLQLLIK